MKSSFLTGQLLFTSIVLAIPIARSTDSNTTYSIQWGPCSEADPAGLDCGILEVPQDWTNPDGEQIALVMARYQANSTAEKKGSLLFNPGGPGGSAVEFCVYQASGVPAFTDKLTQNFDIICPDPRGVGQSTPITCNSTLANQATTTNFPQTLQEFEDLITYNKELGESCLQQSGDLVKYVDTISAAKDLEAIRLALGDEKLNYLGLSYGSQLGSQYAELYPENIRAMALDGIADHNQHPSMLEYVESTGYENTLNRFFEWCAANATVCGFEGSNLAQLFDETVSSANDSPIPAPGCDATSTSTVAGTCRPQVSGNELRSNIQSFLEFQYPVGGGVLPGWELLGFALNQTIADRNATLLSTPFVVDNSTSFAGTAIQCLDWLRADVSSPEKVATAFADLQDKYKRASTFTPHTGGASQSHAIHYGCLGWPVDTVNAPRLLDAHVMEKTPPILLVNSVSDPSTSYTWALSLKEQIPNSVLLTRDGNGHTSYIIGGEATDAIDAYLINGTLPAEGAVVKT